jgi:hypothetical protein
MIVPLLFLLVGGIAAWSLKIPIFAHDQFCAAFYWSYVWLAWMSWFLAWIPFPSVISSDDAFNHALLSEIVAMYLLCFAVKLAWQNYDREIPPMISHRNFWQIHPQSTVWWLCQGVIGGPAMLLPKILLEKKMLHRHENVSYCFCAIGVCGVIGCVQLTSFITWPNVGIPFAVLHVWYCLCWSTFITSIIEQCLSQMVWQRFLYSVRQRAYKATIWFLFIHVAVLYAASHFSLASAWCLHFIYLSIDHVFYATK